MKTNRTITNLSALIFIIYGLLSQSKNKMMFIYLGITFLMISLADWLRKRKK
ncbi:hypothetical protein [Streptococcus sp. sy004]|uniref:hypothetical protein n=1 Tax=Streptococcus sp. sy004 TaxID=2600149 RepID=UPI001647ACB7|nr:hypothetical protein [Streptococcus sp. sy004]